MIRAHDRALGYVGKTLSRAHASYRVADRNLLTKPTAASPATVTERLAAGVAELRDEIVGARRQSTDIIMAIPLEASDILSGEVRVAPLTFGAD